MSPLALLLVLTGALLHATWNLSAKRAAGSGTVAFVWLMGNVSLVFALPFGVVACIAAPQHLTIEAWVAITRRAAVRGSWSG